LQQEISGRTIFQIDSRIKSDRMIFSLKNNMFRAALLFGADKALRKKIKPGAVTVLSFHRITNEPDAFWPATTPETFRKIAAYAAKHFQVITFSELNSISEKQNHKPLLVFSFDDG